MPESVPLYLSISFCLVVVFSLLLTFLALKHSNQATVRERRWLVAAGLLLWIILQSALSFAGIYRSNPDSLPPRIILFGVFPAIVFIAALFLSKIGRLFIDSLDLYSLTFIHVIRIPVELVLYGLFLAGLVPQLMTFEGRNLDIIAGISALVLILFSKRRKNFQSNGLLIWNVFALFLLLNIVVNAALSTPSPFQQFAFDQPNVAILYFPFSLLPAFVVSVVLFSHLAAIRKLAWKKGEQLYFHLKDDRRLHRSSTIEKN